MVYLDDAPSSPTSSYDAQPLFGALLVALTLGAVAGLASKNRTHDAWRLFSLFLVVLALLLLPDLSSSWNQSLTRTEPAAPEDEWNPQWPEAWLGTQVVVMEFENEVIEIGGLVGHATVLELTQAAAQQHNITLEVESTNLGPLLVSINGTSGGWMGILRQRSTRCVGHGRCARADAGCFGLAPCLRVAMLKEAPPSHEHVSGHRRPRTRTFTARPCGGRCRSRRACLCLPLLGTPLVPHANCRPCDLGGEHHRSARRDATVAQSPTRNRGRPSCRCPTRCSQRSKLAVLVALLSNMFIGDGWWTMFQQRVGPQLPFSVRRCPSMRRAF